MVANMIFINKIDLMMGLLWLAIFQFYIPNVEAYYVYQLIIALVIFGNSMLGFKKVPRIGIIALYPLVIVISCLVNSKAILYTQVIRGITYALLIIDSFLFIHKYIRIRGTQRLFEVLYKISRVYFVINILWTIVLIIRGKLEEAVQGEFLFMGGKFTTAYILIFYLMLFYIAWSGNKIFSKRYKNIIFIIQSVCCAWICWAIHTSTGVIAIMLLMILILIPGRILKIINNPIIFVGLIIGSAIIVFSLSVILNNLYVQDLLVNILHEDFTLTGRMQLYELLYPLMMKSGFWGGGFGSYVATQLGYHGWYDAQNGLAEIILTYGFLGAGSFLGLTFISSLSSKKYIEPLNAAILVFVFIAIIEIPFNSKFIFLMALFMFAGAEEFQNVNKNHSKFHLSLRRR